MSKTLKIILAVVLCLAVLGGIAGVVAWTQSDKFDQKDLSYVGKYSVGGLDSAGNYMSTNASIYTKKPIECQGLNCNLVFDSTISYQLYFYDQNNEFVHTTGKLTGTFVEDSIPFFAKYVRIVITPNDDDKVTSLEVGKYAKQLNVSVNREQGFKNYTENLFEIGTLNADISTNGDISVQDGTSDRVVSKFINLSSYKEAMLFRSTDIGVIKLHLYDSEKGHIGGYVIADIASNSFTTSEGYKYYSITFESLHLETEPVFMALWCYAGNPVEIYCR